MLSTQVKAVHKKNETRTYDDSPSSDRAHNAIEVGKIVKSVNRPNFVFAVEWEI